MPTGNFGDIFAGYAAKRMGLPIANLVIATNANDILARTLETGRYETGAVMPTISPAMDIQVSSNFERLLFEALGRDARGVARLMASLAQSRQLRHPADGARARSARDFAAGRADEARDRAHHRRRLSDAGYLLDPHTAVGVAVAGSLGSAPAPRWSTLATAHPAKFPARRQGRDGC